jgi:hypothetical protein
MDGKQGRDQEQDYQEKQAKGGAGGERGETEDYPKDHQDDSHYSAPVLPVVFIHLASRHS